tara:strand:- start:10703 stop:13156 length:2454 start_codon:yes stop_codon:yes gene_type:complete
VPRVVSIQTDFTIGEIDPLLASRIDIDQYYSALQKARNVLIAPQGGISRRPGLKYIDTIASGDSPANGVKLVPFEFSTVDSYMLLFVNNKMFIYRNGTLVTGINGSGNNYLATSIGSATLADMYYTQSADTLVLVQESMAPRKIVRGASHSDWTISTVTFGFVPKHAFTLTTTSPAATLTPSGVSGNITLTASASVFHEGRAGTAQAGASSTITLDGSASAVNDIYNGASVTITGNTGSGQTRIISDYVGSSKVATVSVAWSTNPDSSSTFSVASQVGQYAEANDGLGRARIVRFTSATVVSAITELPFFSTAALASAAWTLESGYEDVWSSTRGYPRTASFHQGRLWFGGTRDRPTTCFASRVSDYFNFNPGQSLDNESIEATIATDTLNAIVGLHSGRDLQIFTIGAEYSVPIVDLSPITPTNIAIKRGSNHGAKVALRPQGSEGGTLFVHRNGKALFEFQFSDVAANYISNNLSLLSSHLLLTPIDMALRKATSTDEGDLLLVVNSSDGSMAAFSFLRSQKVIAPSLFTTSGTFVAVAVDVSDIFVVVKRTINSATVYHVEKFDADFTTDAALQVTPANYGSPLVRGASQTGTSLEIDALTAQPQKDDTFSVAGVTGTYTISAATAISDDGTGTTFKSTLTLTAALASSPADNAAVTFTTVSETRNLTHLPSTSVKVIADDIVLADQTVSSAGVATTERPASSYIEFGIDYTPEVKTMPVETRLASGPITGQKKRILEASLVLDLTQNITVNGNAMSFRAFDDAGFDDSVTTFTGVKTSGPMLGYSRTAQLTFSQSNPLYFNLLGCEYKVSVGQ